MFGGATCCACTPAERDVLAASCALSAGGAGGLPSASAKQAIDAQAIRVTSVEAE
jgi:hypothetical protein